MVAASQTDQTLNRSLKHTGKLGSCCERIGTLRSSATPHHPRHSESHAATDSKLSWIALGPRTHLEGWNGDLRFVHSMGKRCWNSKRLYLKIQMRNYYQQLASTSDTHLCVFASLRSLSSSFCGGLLSWLLCVNHKQYSL